MPSISNDLIASVFAQLREVQQALGMPVVREDNPETLLADLIDSMGLVELLGVLGEIHGLRSETIERAAGHRFTTVASLASALETALSECPTVPVATMQPAPRRSMQTTCWLDAPALRLPVQIQEAEELDALLTRPKGWLLAHAGIQRRHVWAHEDAVATSAEAAQAALTNVGLLPEEVHALLVTSQAPPLLAGLAAALHQRLELTPRCVALEVGGACTGFLQAVWIASRLMVEMETVLIVAVEAPSLHLTVEPGEAGETAALFGDGAAACVASRERSSDNGLSLLDIQLETVGDPEGLLQVEGNGRHGIRLCMEGPRLASRAVDLLAGQVREIAERQRMDVQNLAGVIAHAGNGRMPALLARSLGLPSQKVLSRTAEFGNLGSASLPAAWALHAEQLQGPVVWVTIGAGLNGASACTRETITQGLVS